MITLKPRAGLKIRDYVTHELIPDSGIQVQAIGEQPRAAYWKRLLRDKDVEIVSPAAPSAAPAPEAAPAVLTKPQA
ncbi:DUF2635 domain-containing protein [Gluconobacter morbifer]|uniref:DUF2635 domain-containing protein n=1 Tax=Gluconobacter morbifer TaxID=479935 RepID=UPI00059161B3|nr:DUF2635 domain-containing protein [Gluconobacter morbifer]